MKRLKPLGKEFAVTVLICTRNRFDDTVDCLNSIADQSRLPDEVVIVDSSDTQVLEGALTRRLGHKVRGLVYVHSAPGLTLQRNIGVRQASGDVIIFLDDDVVLEREYIAEHVRVYIHDEESIIAGVQGTFIATEPYGRFRRFYYRLFMLPGETGLGRMQSSGFPSYIPQPVGTVRVDMICGGNTSYRKAVFADFAFDERLGGYAYMEDDEFSYRVSRQYTLVQTPYARLIHKMSGAGRDEPEARQRMDVLNHWQFFSRNMPQTARYRAAFIWSEIGQSLLVLRSCRYRLVRSRLQAYRELWCSTRQQTPQHETHPGITRH